jgi:predicted alpha/beta hydrolase family esterase
VNKPSTRGIAAGSPAIVGIMRFLIVPGINGSDEVHWQSVWEAEWGASASRFAPSSWDEPDLDDWCQALDRAASQDVVLIAHSLGCLAATEWVRRAPRPGVRGLFLVAPPDYTRPDFPAEAATFTTLTPAPVGAPGLVIYGDDDPYSTPEASIRLATGWGLAHVSAGATGHINSASGLGGWDFGRALLIAFAAGIR